MPTSRNTWRGKAFLLRVDQKRIGVSLNRRVKIELAKTVRTDSTLRGYLFIAFLALILRMKLMRLMVEAGLSKRFSVAGLLTELEKIKIMILPDGQKITTETTKKQREILDALNMCA